MSMLRTIEFRRPVVRVLKAAAVVCLLVSIAAPLRAADRYANPLDVRIADPQVLLDNGTYYLYGTGGDGFRVWTSDDLVNWRNRGLALHATAAFWGEERYWAPEVVKWHGRYYMFYSAAGPDGIMRICVASSTSPMGPFNDIAAPLFDNGQAYIDAHVFIDTDNQPYLYCSQDMSHPADNYSRIAVAKLNSTFTGLLTAPSIIIQPSQAWEIRPNGSAWNEGPSVLKHDGYYYLLYSGNVYSSPNYSVGYAYATNPLGPWTKYSNNPIVKKNAKVSGPGHCSWVKSPDGTEYWMVYHTQQQLSGGGERQLAIDKMTFLDQPGNQPDRLVVSGGASYTMRTAPSGAAPFPAGGSDEFNTYSLNRNRWTVFNEAWSRYTFTGSAIRITTVDGDTYADSRANQPNIFLQYPPWDDFRVTTKLTFAPGQNYEQASLFAWQDHNNYIRFSEASIGGDVKFEIGVETNANFVSHQISHNLPATFWMRLEKSGNHYQCYSSVNGTSWNPVGAAQIVNLIDLKIGFSASAPTSGRNLNATFDFFRVEPLNSGVTDWALY